MRQSGREVEPRERTWHNARGSWSDALQDARTLEPCWAGLDESGYSRNALEDTWRQNSTQGAEHLASNAADSGEVVDATTVQSHAGGDPHSVDLARVSGVLRLTQVSQFVPCRSVILVVTPPLLTDLYLAYRQAKIAIFFEHRGIGLDRFAQFESDPLGHLRKLQRKLATNGGWFDGLRLGDVWVTPKKLLTDRHTDDFPPDRAVTRIGVSMKKARAPSTSRCDIPRLLKLQL